MARSLIKNYGLRWHASRVAWTAHSGNVGVWGVPARSRRSIPIDFRDQVAIYVLYYGEAVVYVGQTGARDNRLMSRLRNHRADRLADRWDRFSWFGLCTVLPGGKLAPASSDLRIGPSEVLDQIEAVMLEAIDPRLNRQGGKFRTGITRYVQYPDGRSESATKAM